MNYIVLKNTVFKLDEHKLLPLRKRDILLIKLWRNEQINFLRQNKLLTDEDQIAYYKKVVEASFIQPQPQIILFSYLFKNHCIGYGGLTNIDWFSKRAELSFLLDTQRVNNKELYDSDFSHFISLMKKVAFDALHLNRIFTETFDIRDWHVSILEKNGFRLEGRMKEHFFIENKFVDSLLHGFLRRYRDDI
ncbi:MAG: GNAT family N-acetyltransferase [Thermodesulfovibrionales bacterium]